MTGTEILARANFLVDDDIDSTEALAEINRCLEDLSKDAPFEDTHQATLAVDTRAITVPTDLVSLLEVYVDGTKIGAAISPFATAAADTGTPGSYYLIKDSLNFYPLNDIDAGCTIDLLFLSGYTALTALTETPDVPPNYHIALVFWLCDKFKVMDEEPDAANSFLGKYLTEKVKLQEYWQNRSGEYWQTKEDYS